MAPDPRLVAIRLPAIRAINPPERLAMERAVRRVITPDAFVDLSRGIGAIPDDAAPAVASTQVLAPTGAGYETISDQLDALAPGGVVPVTGGGTGATTASGARANLAVEPTASPTFTGSPTLGVADSAVVLAQGHQRHKSAAPSIAVGAALGTGGSVGATVDGTDQHMTITLTAGNASLATGVAATVTFATARPNQQCSGQLTPAGSNARTNAVQAGLSSPIGTTTFVVSFNVAPTAGQVFVYFVDIWEYSN